MTRMILGGSILLRLIVPLFCAALALSGCSSTPQLPPPPVASNQSEADAAQLARAVVPGYKVGKPYSIAGRWYHPQERFDLIEAGVASWYGPGFHGRVTANGERYDMHALTAAHRTLQLPSVVRVENLDNGRSIVVRVNDRGPYVDDRVIDLSRRAAEELDLHKKGLGRVRLTVLPNESRRMAQLAQNGAPAGQMDDQVALLNTNPPPVEPSPARPPEVGQASVSVAASQPVGNLFLQAAAFSTESNAIRARSLLREFGPVLVDRFQRGDRTLYRVRVGPYAHRDEALTALERLREVGFEGAHLVANG